MLSENVTAEQAARLMDAAARSTPHTGGGLLWDAPTVGEMAAWFPDHEVECLIGRGAMGAVYRAVQRRLGRTVAIKLLPPELAATGDFAARFEREARAMAALSHPNIVAVHDFGHTTGGHAFIVMEHVEGADLSRLLREAPQGLTVPQALGLVSQICDALQYAHGKGCVHRDVKPQNVLVTPDGHVKIADFGLAKLIGPPQPALGVTATGAVLGTPEYVAPEQLKGGSVDHRADIYSLGVMFYEMLTGDLPRGAWEPLSERVPCADTRLDDVVRRAMQREPDRRYQQCSEVKTDVARAQTPPESVPVKKRRVAHVCLGLLMVATGAAVATASPVRDLRNVSLQGGPFLVLALGFFLWRRPVGWLGGLTAGVVAASGIALAAVSMLTFGHRAEAPQLSETTRAEAGALLGDLLNAQEELDGSGGLEGDALVPENVDSERKLLATLRERVERLVRRLPESHPTTEEIQKRWAEVEHATETRLAALTDPKHLAELASKRLDQFAAQANGDAPDPFTPGLTTGALGKLVAHYGVDPADPRIVSLRQWLDEKKRFSDLEDRFTACLRTLREAQNADSEFEWDKLTPEEKKAYTERWNGWEAEAETLRKHPLATELKGHPYLVQSLEVFRRRRPDRKSSAQPDTGSP